MKCDTVNLHTWFTYSLAGCCLPCFLQCWGEGEPPPLQLLLQEPLALWLPLHYTGKETWSPHTRMHISNILFLLLKQIQTFILLTYYWPQLGCLLYKYTREHIKQLSLMSTSHTQMADWNTNKLDNIMFTYDLSPLLVLSTKERTQNLSCNPTISPQLRNSKL